MKIIENNVDNTLAIHDGMVFTFDNNTKWGKPAPIGYYIDKNFELQKVF